MTSGTAGACSDLAALEARSRAVLSEADIDVTPAYHRRATTFWERSARPWGTSYRRSRPGDINFHPARCDGEAVAVHETAHFVVHAAANWNRRSNDAIAAEFAEYRRWLPAVQAAEPRPGGERAAHAVGFVLWGRDSSTTRDPGAWSHSAEAAAKAANVIALARVQTGTSTARPSTYRTVPQERLLDTRSGANARRLQVRDRAGVPAEATAVVLTLTAVAPVGSGWLTVHQADTPLPGASHLNFSPATGTIANTVIVPLTGASDDVVVATGGAGTADVLVDVAGYFVPTGASMAGRTVPIDPVRALDTRRAGPLAAGSTVTIDHDAVPAGSLAAVVTITNVANDGPTYVTAHPSGTDRPLVSLQNAPDRTTRAVTAFVPVDDAGSFDVFSAAAAHLVVDVVGYVTGPDAPLSFSGTFVPATDRLHDSRLGGPDRWDAGEVDEVFVPAGSAGAYNLTATGSTGGGHVTMWAADTAEPATSNLNLTHADLAGFAIVRHGRHGQQISLRSTAATDLVVDLAGWFLG